MSSDWLNPGCSRWNGELAFKNILIGLSLGFRLGIPLTDVPAGAIPFTDVPAGVIPLTEVPVGDIPLTGVPAGKKLPRTPTQGHAGTPAVTPAVTHVRLVRVGRLVRFKW